jgi:hypothetical protein
MVPILVCSGELSDDVVCAPTGPQELETSRAVAEVGEGLRGDGSGTGSDPRDGRTDGEELGRDRDPPLRAGVRRWIPRDDGERHELLVSGSAELLARLERVPARGHMVPLHLAEGRHVVATIVRNLIGATRYLAGFRTTGMEGTARRGVDRGRNVSFECDALG